jgi:hypothetical protein
MHGKSQRLRVNCDRLPTLTVRFKRRHRQQRLQLLPNILETERSPRAWHSKSRITPSLHLQLGDLPQFFSDRGGRISNFIDGSLQFVSANAKMFGPIFHL